MLLQVRELLVIFFLFTNMSIAFKMENTYLQGVDHFKKIMYTDGITYGELFLENEYNMLLHFSFTVYFTAK